MTHLFKVIYYQYFRFYKRYENFGEEPHPHARYTLAFSISPLIYTPLSFLATYYCYDLQTWMVVAIPILVIFCMYILKWQGIDHEIEKEKPMLFGSVKWSVFIAVLFWAGSTFVLLYGGVRAKEYRDERRYECPNLR